MSSNGDRTYIVREPQMQQPPKCLLVTDDVNELAHSAMDDLQEAFGNKRIMTKKPEYDIMIARLKEHKKVTNKNTQKIK